MTKPSKPSQAVADPSTGVVTQRDDADTKRSVRVFRDGTWRETNTFGNTPAISEVEGHFQNESHNSVTLSVRVYDSPYGNNVLDDGVAFFALPAGRSPFTGANYPKSALSWDRVANFTQSSGGRATSAFYLTAAQDQHADPMALSPDYAAGYINVTASDAYFNEAYPNTLPNYAQFEVRYWGLDTAVISAYRGDGQYTTSTGVFQTPLSVKVTDSVGSMEATHNKWVVFTIQTPDLAEFDFAGDNQTFLYFSTLYIKVWCQNGIATAPRIKAKGQTGTVKVQVQAAASAGDYWFILKISDKDENSAVAYCSAAQNDHQDVVVGNAFADNLVAKAQTKFHQPATTGLVTFTVFSSPVAGQVADILFPASAVSVDKQVEAGFATADPLVSTTKNAYGPAGYATAYVYAYPQQYQGDPRYDTTGTVTTFIQRVWKGRVATMSVEAGDQQKQAAGLTFDQRLKTKVLGQDQQGVNSVAVTFDLTGYAEFIQGDSVPVITWTPTSVTVATDNNGIATAPSIRATANKEGVITVTASSAVSNSQPFSLTSEVPSGTTLGLEKSSGDLQDQHINEYFPFELAVLAQAANGPAQAGQITFTSVPDAATGAFVADPTTPTKQSSTSTASVNDGAAAAPEALMAVDVTNPKQNYGSFTVTATGPYISYPATFKERVWRDKNAILSQDSDTPQNDPVIENFPFRYPVAVKVKDPSLNLIDDLLVTFSITGPATFQYDASQGHQGTATAAMVYTRNGIATSPTILAGDSSASVTITADANVAAAPVTFQLEVLEGDTAAYYTYTADGDKQDQKINGAFPIPLTVAAKTLENQPATTGEVYFEIQAGTATASFSGVSGLKTKVQVVNGTAKAPPVVAGETSTADAGTVTVYAYPASYTGDPKLDQVASQVATFTLNVWPDDYVTLVAGPGNQQADMGSQFPARLTVAPQNKHEGNTPLPDYLVTFTITDGPAVFDSTDDPGDTVSRPNNRTAIVRSNWRGIATAPYLLAGDSGGPVSVVASDAMGNTATYPNLTVTDPAPPLYTLSAVDSPISIPVNGSNNASFKLKATNNSGAEIQGIPINLVLQNGTHSRLSFSPTTSLTTTAATTNAQGVASVTIYGGSIAGNGLLFATQSQAAVDNSIPVDVQVYSG